MPIPPPAEADQSLLRDVQKSLQPEGGEEVTGLVITSINGTAGIQKRPGRSSRSWSWSPNLCYLVGAACLGNTVVAFRGHPGDFPAGVVWQTS